MARFRKVGSSWRVEVTHDGISKSRLFPLKAHAMAWAVDTEREIDGSNGCFSEPVWAGLDPEWTVKDCIHSMTKATPLAVGTNDRVSEVGYRTEGPARFVHV